MGETIRSSDPAVPFGFAYSIAVIAVALVDALTVLIPGLEEGAEEAIGPAWLYMGMLGIILFAGLGFFGVGRGQSRRRAAYVVIASTVLSGLVIVGVAARAGMTGSM